MKILLVDDQPAVRAMVRTLLAKFIPAEFTEADDGEEACNCLKQQRYDIVISDQWMDHCHGTDLLKFLEENPHRASYFMIYTSDVALVRKLQQNNLCPAVAKPDVTTLLSRVTEACCINFFS